MKRMHAFATLERPHATSDSSHNLAVPAPNTIDTQAPYENDTQLTTAS